MIRDTEGSALRAVGIRERREGEAWNEWTMPAFRSEKAGLNRRDTEARCGN